MTLVEHLESAGTRGDRLFTFETQDPAVQWTLEELVARAKARAGALQSRGLEAGERVALIDTTTPPLVETLIAVWLCGAAPCLLPPPPRLGGGAYQSETRAKLEALEPKLILRAEDFEALDQGEWRRPKVSEDDLALIQFSSGSTRDPAPIGLSHANLWRNCSAILDQFPGGATHHRCVSWLPLYHDMGLIGCLLSALLAQGELVLLRPEQFISRPLAWLRAIDRHRATTSAAPNFALSYVCQRTRPRQLQELDLSCWSIAMVGAEPVQPATLERFCEHLSPAGFQARALAPVYGLAEATLGVTFTPFEEPYRVLGIDRARLAEEARFHPGEEPLVSVGRTLPGVELEVRDEHGGALPQGALGRVYLKSPGIMTGYLGQPQRTREVLRGDWLDTGDLGFLVDDHLYLYGRAKDLLILSGRNHDPAAVEASLEGLEGIRRSAAYSTVDQEKGTEVLVLVTERMRNSGDPSELAQKVKSTVMRKTGLVPAQVLVVEGGSLPLTSSGKIRRGKTRQEVEAGRLEPVGSC